MAKTKDPAFLFYPNDYMGGTMGMTFEQKGAYMDLLIMQFNQGAFTLDQAKNILKEAFERIWPALSPKFLEKDGRLYNERLELEKLRRQEFIKKQSAAGKKGGRPRKDDQDGETQIKPNPFFPKNPTLNPNHNPNKTIYENENDFVDENVNQEEIGGMGEKEGEQELFPVTKTVIVAMLEVWMGVQPEYEVIAEDDEPALAQIALFIAGKKDLPTKEKIYQSELLNTWKTWCLHIRGSTTLQHFSLSKINRFYKQQIVSELKTPQVNGAHKQTPGGNREQKRGTSTDRMEVAKRW